MSFKHLPLLAGLLLAGCTATTPTVQAPPPPPRMAPDPPGLVLILRKSEAEVLALLGAASMSRSEGPARQLQFIRPPCILDAFLYPDATGVLKVRTAVARKPDGSRMEPGACLTLILPVRP
jgi:hypothetical protein